MTTHFTPPKTTPSVDIPTQLLRWAGLLGYLGVFLFALLVPNPVETLAHSFSVCMFKNISGLPCLTCGMTRAFTLMAQGQWFEAMQYHLLSIPVFLGGLLFTLGLWVSPKETLTFVNKRLTPRRVLFFALLLVTCWVLKLMGPNGFW